MTAPHSIEPIYLSGASPVLTGFFISLKNKKAQGKLPQAFTNSPSGNINLEQTQSRSRQLHLFPRLR